MELKIYDKQGLVRMTVSPDNSSQWNHEVGSENVVTVNFTTWEFLILEVGWYILVKGQRFSIKSEYRPKHIHDTKYTYNLKFYGREHDAQDILFCRLNQGEDDLESVFAYDGTPMDFLQKVVANMNRNTDGVEWKAGEAISANRQTINFNGLYCWDALGEIARAFGTEWWMDGEYVNLNKCIRGEYVSLGYGQGLKSGLTQNESTNSVKWFTRLIPVGSSKNIDKSKYGYANLQLPGREKYIDINSQYGLKEYREEAAFSEIYPHRVGTISSVRSEERTNEETGSYTVYYVKDSSLPFNPDEYMIGGEVIHMTFNSGALAGKDFEVNWNNETKEFEIINQYPDENTQLPGGNLVPSADDTYVLWNISMPYEYIRAAEQELKEAVDAYLAEYSKDISVYSGSTDYIYIAKNNVPLLLGQRIRLISEQYFDEGIRESRITRVSRKLNNLGEASIDCSDAIGYSWVSGIKSSVNSTIVNQESLKGKTEELEKDVSYLNEISKFWELKESPNGSKYLFSKLPLATQYGITMYANGGGMNIPSIYDGLPIDGTTLIRDKNGVLMINPDIEFGGGASSWGELEGKPDWITNTKPIYDYSEIKGTPDLSKYALADDLKKYVPISGDTDILGLKNFTKGLKIDGLGITKSQDDVIYLDANLVVRGGITMYGIDSVDAPTIMDAIATDNVNLKVVDGVLTFVGASGGLSEVHWDDVIGRPTLLSSFVDDVVDGHYLPLSGGKVTGQIGYNFDKGGNIPAAGAISYSNATDFTTKKSFLGNGQNTTNGNWYNLISVRADNDSDNFGMYIGCAMTDYQGNLFWNKQEGYEGAWQGERVILDSVNWSQYIVSVASDAYRLCSAYGKPVNGDMANRPTSANNVYTDKSLRYYLATSSMTTGKPMADGCILHCAWDNSGWNSQLYIPNSNGLKMQYRGMRPGEATSWGDWVTLIDSNGGSINGDLTVHSIKLHDINVIDSINDNMLHLNYYSSANISLCYGGGLVGIGIFRPSEKVDIHNSKASTNTFVHTKRTDTGYGISFGVGSGGVNRGLYDDNLDRWIIYADSSGVNLSKNIWITQDAWANGLNLNRSVAGGGCSIAVWSAGTHIGNFGINGTKQLEFNVINNGTATTKFTVDSSGNGLFYGGVTMYSDIRKKTKLADVELTLQQVANAPLIQHYYNSDEKRTTHVGSVAQYWASMNDWFCKLDGEGYYTMEIQNAALASAISIARELQRYESKTDKKIRLLKKRIGELEDEIKELKKKRA